ncbi:hypothetical protein [Silvimonas iriomotensis]|uniref:Cobalt transport protein n=1 Tax=Silvimonas iriomotensis TaxID=449662 RepID=A0ABQ2P5H8_9NEIS|nr:hypothetical protein [Silvimonas iriomotensis]GGP18641.1 hypothetical protein GCM10010970_06180 [Silvimonas iriomotensis]
MLQPTPLVIVTAVLVVVTFAVEAARMTRMLRRMRVLLLAILLVYGWSTPGLYLWSGGFSPTREGLWLGFLQAVRLVGVLTSLQWLLRSLTREAMFGGIYLLAAPLTLLGVNRQRWALRLTLTMDFAERLLAERQDWRALWQQISQPLDAVSLQPVAVTLQIRPLSAGQRALLLLLLALIVLTLLFFHQIFP